MLRTVSIPKRLRSLNLLSQSRVGLPARFVAQAALSIALLAPTPAPAAWMVGETEHFKVYANGSQRDLEEIARHLERVRDTLKLFSIGNSPGEESKLEVYVLSDSKLISEINPSMTSTAGFYSASAGARFLVATRRRQGIAERGESDDTLAHEYAHHFMLQHFSAAYPSWVVEGYAQYFQTVEFDQNRIIVGNSGPRLLSRAAGDWFPWSQVLTGTYHTGGTIPRDRIGTFYGQAWLLTHYMLSDPTRRAAFNEFLGKIADGFPADRAFFEALQTDEDSLSAVMRNYLRSNRYATVLTRREPVSPKLIVTALPGSADDLLLLDLRARRWVAEKDYADFVSKVRDAAARHPGDPLANRTLARAEAFYGDPVAAENLAKVLLLSDPTDGEGWFILARSLERQADAVAALEEKLSLIQAASGGFDRAVALAPERHEIPLHYARWLKKTGQGAPKARIDLLLQAYRQAPQVNEVRLELGDVLIAEGRQDDALTVLEPLANAPHGGQDANRAAVLIASLRAEANALSDESARTTLKR